MGFSLDSAEALQSCSTDTILEASSRIALLTRALKAANEATNLARQCPTVMHPPKVLRRADYLSSSSSSSSVPALPNVPPSPAPPHASPASAVPRSGPPIGSSGSSARECLRPQHEPVKVAPREDNPKREASTSSRATALLAKVPAEAEGNETPQAEQGKEATAERPSPPIWEHTRTRGCPIFTRTHPAFAALVGKADAEVPRVRVENKQAADADSNNHSSETFRAKRKSRRHRHRKIYELNRAKEAAERYLATAEQARQRSRSLFSPSLSPDAGLLRSAPLREAAGASGSAAAAAWKTARNHGRPAALPPVQKSAPRVHRVFREASTAQKTHRVSGMRAEKKHGDASLVPPTRSPFSPPPPRAFPVSPLPSPLLPPPQKWIVATEKRVHPSARAAATALESVGRSQGERKTFVTRVLQAMLAQRYRVSNQESERVWRRVLAGILNRLTTTTKSAVPSHAYHLAACADSVPSASSAASSHACPVESAAATAASGSLAAPPPPRASWVSPLPSRILPPPPKWLVVNEEGGHPTAPVAATPVAVQKSFFAGAPAGAGAKLGSTGQTDEERRAVYSWVLKTLRERQARAGNQGSDESGQPDLGGTLNPTYPITATNGAVPGHACDSGPFPYFVPSASLASSLHACPMGSAAATASSGSLDAPPPSPYIHPPIFAARPPPSSASSASALAWPEWPRASSSGSEPLQVHFRVKWKQGAHRNICVALVAKCQELAWSPLAPLFSSPAYSRRSVACQSSSFASSSPPLSPSCSFGEAPKSLCSLSTVASLGPPAASAPFAGSARPSQSSSSAFLVSSRLPLLLKQVAPRDGAEDEWTSDPLLLQSVAPGHVVPFVFLLWDTEKGGPARIEPVPDRRWFALPRARGSYTIDAGAFQDARGGQAAVYPTPPPVNRGPWDMAFDDEF